MSDNPTGARAVLTVRLLPDRRALRQLTPRHSGAATALLLLIIFSLVVKSTNAATKPLEETIEQKYSLDSDATLRISNTDGSIRIYAAETSEILIQATKKAYSTERLKGIVVDVQATRKTVTVGTAFPPRKNAISDRSGTVDYMVIVPQAIRISQLELVNGEITVEGLRGGSARAHVKNGWITGQNCFADLDLTVETGRLDIFYGWWEGLKFTLRGSSDRGIVRAFLPSDASVMLNATTGTGRIINAFDTKNPAANDTIRSLNTVLGSNAEAAIELRGGTGDIQIHRSY